MSAPASRQLVDGSTLSVPLVPPPKIMHKPGILPVSRLSFLSLLLLSSSFHLREQNMCEMLPETLVLTLSILGWKGRKVVAGVIQSLVPVLGRADSLSCADSDGFPR